MKKPLFVLLFLLLAATGAGAEKIKYFQDPVYQKLNAGDPHPMNDLIGLAEDRDVRAQFILGDLYAKGKGGLSKNEKKAAYWFEQSAKAGYYPSFVRLAALAKRRNAPEEAYKWYTLAIEHFGAGKDQKYAVSARNALAESAGLSNDAIKRARQAADAWKVSKVRDDREDAFLKKPAPKKTGKKEQPQPAEEPEKSPNKEILFNE